jgi:hypothetical protein
MKKITILLLLSFSILSFSLFSQSGDPIKPGITIYLLNGSTASGRLDTIDDRQVVYLDKSNQAAYIDRSKVLSIAITADSGGKFAPGQQGIVLKNGTVLKGKILKMDFSDRSMPQLMVETRAKKTESTRLSDIAFIQFTKPFPQVSAPPGATRVEVPAYQPWTDTPVEVKKGYRMFFSVSSDNVIFCGPKSVDVNADGANPLWVDRNRPIPDVKECTLIGRVGHTGTPFKIGLNTTPYVAQEDGRLRLGINDSDFRDNDGILVVYIKVETAQQFQPGSSTGLSQSTVTVPANAPWTPTNISVKKGQRLQFDVSSDNMVRCDFRAKPSNADGVDPLVADQRRPMANNKACMLMGKINNNGEPFKIGLNKTPVVVQQDGTLLLGINDFDFRDNTGSFTVTVIVN